MGVTFFCETRDHTDSVLSLKSTELGPYLLCSCHCDEAAAHLLGSLAAAQVFRPQTPGPAAAPLLTSAPLPRLRAVPPAPPDSFWALVQGHCVLSAAKDTDKQGSFPAFRVLRGQRGVSEGRSGWRPVGAVSCRENLVRCLRCPWVSPWGSAFAGSRLCAAHPCGRPVPGPTPALVRKSAGRDLLDCLV